RSYVPEPVGLPVLVLGEVSAEDHANLHYGEVGLAAGELVTAGYHGWTLVVTGTGPTIRQARDAAYRLAGRVVIPNVRYRIDIGDKLMAGEWLEIERLGLLDPA
ncbi:MAG: hypothetical protein JWR86_2580, partial [Enterovirga sp.]|nr:hypothetical protein [Enterovirga sp.]